MQVQSEVVHVWPGELVRTQEQEELSGGEWKRRTLEEPDMAAARAKDEVKRARYRGVRELRDSARQRTKREDVDVELKDSGRERSANDVDPVNLTDSVTSEDTRYSW